MKRVWYLIASVLLILTFLASCSGLPINSYAIRPTHTKGMITGVTKIPAESTLPSSMVVQKTENSFVEFFCEGNELWKRTSSRTLSDIYYPNSNCMDLSGFNVYTFRDITSLKENEILIDANIDQNFDYVLLYRQKTSDFEEYWVEIRNLNMQDPECSDMSDCDINFIIGIGEPFSKIGSTKPQEVITSNPNYGLFLVFRNFHDGENSINRVCLLRSIYETCSFPIDDLENLSASQLNESVWTVGVIRQGDQISYKLYRDGCQIMLPMEESITIKHPYKFYFGYYIQNEGKVYAEITIPEFVPFQ